MTGTGPSAMPNGRASMTIVTELSAHFLAACRSDKSTFSQQRKLS
jgi:hypothetical protein